MDDYLKMIPQTLEPKLLSPLEAGQIMGLDRVCKEPAKVILKLARKGYLRSIKVGKFVMIDPASVDHYIKGQQ